jgi:cellulose synthase/poly-beta-1,6-N-acetylglucosamine synthase-like glycosyltransferase
VGINAEDHLPLLRRIYREGYEIGNHTFTHPNMALVSSERAVTEMEATRLLLEANTSHSTILFRAPFNADAEPTKAVELKPIERAREDHYYTVGESIDPEDWDVGHGVNADSIYNRVVRQYELYGGEKGIILLHDAGGNREATVAALPRIIHYFKQRKVQFATIGDILHLSKDEIMPAVHNQVLTLSWFVSGFVYWLGHFLVAAFWLAIVLSLGRIALIGMLSFIQLRRSKKEIAAPLIKSAVSIIVPAYNEEVNAVKTVKNLLQQDYGNIEIIFVDDGSTDATYSSVQDAFLNNPRVKVFTKSNSGKAAALNYGIAQAATEFLICIDADTQLMPDAISRMMKYFTNDNVGAVAGNVKVGNERNMLTRWQSIEYITAQNFDRRAFDLVNCITVVPGAIGAFRKKAVLDAGGFTSDTLAEDCDLTIRILRKGYVVRSASDAIAVTEAPETFRQFMRQRFRWSYGIMQSFWKNKDACFNPKYKTVGMVALPNILLFQILVPVLAPAADLLLILGLIWNRNDPESMNKIFLFYGLFLAVDIVVSFIAFIYEKEKLTKLLWLIPQRFVYRQLMYVILFRSIRKAVKGETQSWGVLKRTGGVKLIHDKSVIGDQ